MHKKSPFGRTICFRILHFGSTCAIITVTYGAAAGAFYAMATLVQLAENRGESIPCLAITDEPTFPVRGYMLDLGRGKIPKREEMCDLIDWLASMKVNHVELYFEGVPFEYPSFPEMWAGRDVMSGEDILALDAYCRARFIDLVPTQNHFGHMDAWLLEKYRHLAECPNGFDYEGSFFPFPRCLDPQNPESLSFMQTLQRDLVPYFSSPNFNICCDETLELGKGHNKEACETKGKGRVYLDFLLKVIDTAQSLGKRVLFWDDIIKHYPELLSELPEDAVVLDWGYLANEPLEADSEMLHKAGVTYYICPGTGAWNTLLGMTNQMITNIRNASDLGMKYGASGLLNTDWGDCGHLQSLPTSYSGIAYGAAMAWSPVESREMNLAGMLDTLVFRDAAGVMGQLVLDAGNYFEVEGVHPANITHSFVMLILLSLADSHAVDATKPEDYERVAAYLDELMVRLATVDLRCDKAELILDEYRLALRLIRLAQDFGSYHFAEKNEDVPAQTALLEHIVATLPVLMDEVRRTWRARNREAYLAESLGPLGARLHEAEEKLAALRG